ncbi:hypothetical protein ACIRYZ_14560 [Kitasatospora sp. NPDC101155]|uniref:hypothetical protein n=1 Tax=Kitasatospora sp. NPDC101155 TaxID=3364097 RepID=UPI00380077B6
MHELYRGAGCPSTRRISKEVSNSPFSRDEISHQSVANMLTGKAFPGWLRWESLIGVLISLAREDVTADRIKYVRQLWVPVHYGEGNSEPPLQGLIDDIPSSAWPGPDQAKPQPEPVLAAGPPPGSGTGPERPKPSAANGEHDRKGPNEPRTVLGEERESNNKDAQYVRFVSGGWSGPEMFFVESLPGLLQVGVNTQHPVGSSISKIIERGDEEASTVLKLLLFSWARMEDETPSERSRNRVKNMRSDWSKYAGMLFESDDDDD